MSIGLALGLHLGRGRRATPPVPPTLHRSTFAGADGTALAAYTPEVGAAWINRAAATWQLAGNRVRKLGANGWAPTTTPTGATDVDLTATIVYGGGRSEGVVVRDAGDEVTGYLALLNNHTNYRIVQFANNGVQTVLATGGGVPPVTGAVPTTIRWVVKGDRHTVYENGVPIIGATIAINTTQTRHGFIAWNASDTNTAGIDDVTITGAA